MSKIRLNGTTSGYTELAPPAAAGSNTITLPSGNGSANQFLKNGSTAGTLGWSSMVEDSSGNVNIDSGTLYVDAVNNRVGIGNSNPGYSFVVGNGTATVDTALVSHSTGAVTHRYDIGGTGTLTVGFNNSGLQINNLPTGVSGLWMQQAYPLIFATSGTERARITSGGLLLIGDDTVPTTSNSLEGALFTQTGTLELAAVSDNLLFLNRKTTDGNLVTFRQDGTSEGTISVSGTTVSYNGAHLSRWSQLLGVDPHDKDARPEILRGTVMSNLDEMCDWIDPESGEPQANEQLNKTKISDVEGDKNVAGVFQSWDDDDDTWVNDFYLAMTGDFVIRIAEGVTVERGDLLMSAGDGTAKPQDDDLIRSSTVAKVTSTTVSHVHPDGSYCIPCVLMAC